MKIPGKKSWLPWLLLCLCIAACTLFIWGNSSLPASQSAMRSRQLLSHLWAVFDYFEVPTAVRHTMLRKLAHVAEFALLGTVWTAALLRCRRWRLPVRLAAACGVCLLTALLDETIQRFSPGRGSMLRDVWIDCAGSTAGMMLALAGYGLWRWGRGGRR
ncbi:VanZ family protein [uncultured Flavonifractor sp.]|uniref:VanZ family protein n=1 Tax=uncultured Flavonifractor sp. TaxID=1193534 RepID=UPI00262BE0CB|nr:VanZ family protein [uncultured Flavonifractor sp.]